jgi:hypothetical protein
MTRLVALLKGSPGNDDDDEVGEQEEADPTTILEGLESLLEQFEEDEIPPDMFSPVELKDLLR